MLIHKRYLISLALVIVSACGKNSSFEGQKKEGPATAAAPVPASADGSSPGGTAPAGKPIIPSQVGTRPIETVLCQDGYKLLNLIEKTSFHEDFALACAPDQSTVLFQELISKAYAGSGDPHVKLVQFKVAELFVTRMIVAYAMKVPLNDPSLFYSLKAHDTLASGIKEKNSEVVGLVESRRNFPGRRSVEEIVLNYSLNKSEGGGLFDKRRTEFNTYLLSESSTDVVLATEELLDAASNKTYHDYKGLLLGLKAEPGYTYLVFINDFTIKNRIDPLRLQRTLIALSQGMQKKMYNFFTSKGAAQ
jgi:hypothetical protein